MQLVHYCLFNEKSIKQPFWGKNELSEIVAPPHPHPPTPQPYFEVYCERCV